MTATKNEFSKNDADIACSMGGLQLKIGTIDTAKRNLLMVMSIITAA